MDTKLRTFPKWRTQQIRRLIKRLEAGKSIKQDAGYVYLKLQVARAMAEYRKLKLEVPSRIKAIAEKLGV